MSALVSKREGLSPLARRFLIKESIKRKRSLSVLLVMTIIGTFLELLGIGAVFPIILIKINPEMVQSHRLYRHVEQWLGITEVNQLIYWLTGFMVTAFFLRNLHLIALTYIRTKMLTHWKEDLAREMMQYYLRVPYPYILRRTSSLLMRNIHLTGHVFDRTVISIISLISNFILVLAIVGLVAMVQPVITLLSATALFTIILLQNRFMKHALVDAGDLTAEGMLNTQESMQQSLGAAREARLMGKTSFFVRHFNNSYKKISRAYIVSQVLKAVPPLITQFLLVLIIALMLLSLMQMGNELAFPSLGLMAMAAFRLAPRFNNIQYAFNTLFESQKSVERVAIAFSELEAQVPSSTAKIHMLSVRQKIELKQVSFSYKGKKPWLLTHINLQIPKGAMVGIMGASGAGKSTLIDIILGLLPPSEGDVIVDGTPVHDPQTMRILSAGFVSQHPFFITGTIRQNIGFGMDAEQIDNARVWETLEKVGLREYVSSLRDGLDYFLGENAGQFSGGQRQRLAIARALYANDDFIVLDEPTSALDIESESQIISLLAQLKGKTTVILISHRESAMAHCDQRLFLEQGRLIEDAGANEGISVANI